MSLFNDDNVDIRGNVIMGRQFSSRLAYPNPFSPSGIDFDLPAEARVTLKIFDAGGREVASLIEGESFGSGTHHVDLDPADWNHSPHEPKQAFYYRLSIEVDGKNYFDTKQIVFTKS
jgi:hypothetical protein